MNKQRSKNSGSALLVAIITGIVVVAFSLSLLLVCYALFQSSTKASIQLQVKEVAKSVSKELENEITSPEFLTSDAFLKAINNEEGVTYPANEYSFWFYLRYNIFQENWPYYSKENIMGHTKQNAQRFFKVEFKEGNNLDYVSATDDVSVCMYWQPPEGGNKDGAILYVEVTATKADQKTKIVTCYELSVLSCSGGEDNTMNNSFNPKGNTINLKECWKWTKQEVVSE